MADLDINQVLADNLRAAMDRAEVNQTALGKKSGVAQNTISLYLKPEKRKPGVNGKEPSGKVTEVARMASALGLDAWQLLLPNGGGHQGNVMNGWPLSAELLAALHSAGPEKLQFIENTARLALGLKVHQLQVSETTGAAA